MVRGVQMWQFRTEVMTDLDPYKQYAGCPNMFSIKVHHGGRFTGIPNRKYITGKVQYVDLVDSEHFTVEVLNNIIKMLKYNPKQIMFYHFKIPRKSLDWGLRALACDDDVVNLIKYVSKHKVIEVYIEHNKTSVESFYNPTFRGGVEIRELNDNDEIVDVDEDDVQEETMSSCRKNLAIEWNNTEQNDDVTDHNDVGLSDVEEGVNEHIDEPVSDHVDEGVSDDTDIVDDEHMVEEVEVNMDGFNFRVDEPLHAEVNMTEDDIEELDFDSYDSDIGDDSDSGRKSALRKLKKQGKAAAAESRIANFFYVGQEFANKGEATKRIKAHIVETRRNVKLKKNDAVRLRANCFGTIPALGSGHMESLNSQKERNMDKGKKVIEQVEDNKCPWSLYIHLNDSQKWVVRSYTDEHKCLLSRKIKACTSSFLSEHVVDLIQLNPKMPSKAIQDQMQKQFHVGVSIHKAYRAKAKAESVLKGDAQVQYSLLHDYVVELQRCNPNTTVRLDFEREGDPESVTRTFKRIYVCLGGLKQGFKAGGRDLLGLDGAFMKGQYPGQLLTAVSVDGNNGIYHVAYGIVESESLHSWLWFLSHLGNDLDLESNSNFTFITDRQKGLLPAIKKLFPAAEHRFCVRHINQNMNLTWRGGEFKDLLWKAATSTTTVEFTNAMNQLKGYNIKAYEWLNKIAPEHWTRSHFSGRAKCDLLINNICEVFNRQLLDARDSPIISALEYVREYLMKRIVIVQKIIQKNEGPLTPAATKIFNRIKNAAANYIVEWNGLDLYQAKGPHGDQCVVNLTDRNCSCRKWEVSGMPCRHAVACINDMGDNGMGVGFPEDWVDPVYRLERWREQYSFKINPTNGRNLWVKHDWPTLLLPPKVHVQIGRPQKKRKKSAGEVEGLVRAGKLTKKGMQVTCQICKGKGHNKRSCKQAPSAASQSAASQPAASQNQTEAAASQSTVPRKKKTARHVQYSGTNVQASNSQPSTASMVQSTPRLTKKTANRVLSPTKNV